MEKENALLNRGDIIDEAMLDSFDIDDLENQLESELEEEFEGLAYLEEEQKALEDPDKLGDVIKEIVWEQFLNQMAVVAGEDFIKENRGLTLDLRNDAHIQTTENFAKGKIATHNAEIDYGERRREWRNNMQTDPSAGTESSHRRYNKEAKVWEKKDHRSGKWKSIVKKEARADYDKGRPKGNLSKNTNVDHTVPASEYIRDPATNAHLTHEERVAAANSKENLNVMDSAANQSKGDSTMQEFLDSERDGKKPEERFPIDREALEKKEAEARKKKDEVIEEGERKSVEAGKKSQREEAIRIGKHTLRAVAMQLLAELLKEIMGKLIQWFRTANKKIETLIDSIKEAVSSFVGKMKTHLKNAANTAFTTIVTAIFGPIIGTIKKFWMMLKQGFSILKNVVKYIMDPTNKGKSVSVFMMEISKIIIVGLTGASAIALGEVIEKGLMLNPFFAFEIPLLGSLANILGIFLGAIIGGIVGAIGINFLNKWITKKKKKEIQAAKVDQGSKIIAKQNQLLIVEETLLERDKSIAQDNITQRHQEAATIMKDAFSNIMEDFVEELTKEDRESNIVDDRAVTFDIESDYTMDELDSAANELDDLLK